MAVATALAVGGNVAKGVSGYKAGQASSKAAQATAMYNQMITQINAQMQDEAGDIERVIGERNAEDVAEQASYNAFLLERQAEEVQIQNDFDLFVSERQSDIFTAEKRATWGSSGVTMRGSPAVVALADAHASAMNLANVQQRGLQAVSRVNQASKMTEYQGKVAYNNLMQTAYMKNYASDIQRANIINEGNMNYFQNALKSYTAQAQATSALIGGISDAVSAGASAYVSEGGSFDDLFSFGGGGSASSGSNVMGPFNTLQSNSTGSFNASSGGGDIFDFGWAKDTSGWQFQ